MLGIFCLNESGRRPMEKSGEPLEGMDYIIFTFVSLLECYQIGVAQ